MTADVVANGSREAHSLVELFPIYVGVLLWGGLFLREDRLRALIPSRRAHAESARDAPSWRPQRTAS